MRPDTPKITAVAASPLCPHKAVGAGHAAGDDFPALFPVVAPRGLHSGDSPDKATTRPSLPWAHPARSFLHGQFCYRTTVLDVFHKQNAFLGGGNVTFLNESSLCLFLSPSGKYQEENTPFTCQHGFVETL